MKSDFQHAFTNITRARAALHIAADDQAANRALELAWEVRAANPKRPSSLAVALRLQQLHVDRITLQAALLSSPALVDLLPADRLEQEFGALPRKVVESIRWLNQFKERDISAQGKPEQIEAIRRMVLAMVEDVRAVVVKLAYRVLRLEMLGAEDPETRRAVARQSLELYAPLANRIGIGQLRWELEDLAFRFLEPQAYKQLVKALDERRSAREAYVREFVAELEALIEAAGLPHAKIYGRPKHIYSIWRKMQHKQLRFEDLFDVRAVRVIVESIPQCYLALGIVHGKWRALPHEFDDYIAHPKANGYQSLHTAIVSETGKTIEVQIRSTQMHDFAEHGIAAHWRYKEQTEHDSGLSKAINSLRQLLENSNDDEFLLEQLRADLYSDRVFVLTPDSDVIDLPRGSTPLDFAYHVHTEVGHRCRGAKINGQIVNLRYVLKNGDQVEVLTTKELKPSRDWLIKDLGFLHTARARSKVRNWFNLLDHESHVDDGKRMFQQELKRLNLTLPEMGALITRCNCKTEDDFYVGIARGEIGLGQVANSVQQLTHDDRPLIFKKAAAKKSTTEGTGIQVRGVGNLLTQLARCCNPLPPDAIVGFVTRGKGVSVHRADCKNVLSFDELQRERLIEVSWGVDEARTYTAQIRLVAYDRQGLLRDVAGILANEKINLSAANTQSDVQEQTATMLLTIEIRDMAELSRVLKKILQLPNVLEAYRLQ